MKTHRNLDTARRLRRKDARTEYQALTYLNTKLAEYEEASEEDKVVGVVVFDQKQKRINVYGPVIDQNHASYRFSTLATNYGLHPTEWRYLSRAYRQGYLVKRQELYEDADENEWVAVVGIPLSERFEGSVIAYSNSFRE